MRAETMRAIRDEGNRDATAGKLDPAGWNAASPWTCVYRLAAEDANWWDEQVTRPAAAWIARGGRGAPVTVEEQLAARIMPGYESNVATPRRKRRKDDSTASDEPQTPASQKKKLQRASKRQCEKVAKQELASYRQHAKGGGKNDWNKWQQPAKGSSKGKNSNLPAIMDKKQRTHDTDGKTEICMMWNKKHGKRAGVAVCPM